MKSFNQTKPKATPKRPSPDLTSSPDKHRKTLIFSTTLPSISQDTIKLNRDQKKSYTDENSKLKQQNSILKAQNQMYKLQIDNLKSLSGSIIRPLLQNAQVNDPITQRVQQFVDKGKQALQYQFNRQMTVFDNQVIKKMNELSSRVLSIQSKHQKVMDLSFNLNLSSMDTSRTHKMSFENTKQPGNRRYKDLLKQLQSSLLVSRQQNKHLTKQLKQIKSKQNNSSVNEEEYQRKIQSLNKTIDNLKSKLHNESEFDQMMVKQGMQYAYTQKRDRQIYELTQELEKQKQSKDRSEKALQIVQRNFQVSQQSLEFMKKQNQKLKQQSTKMQSKLQQAFKVKIQQNKYQQTPKPTKSTNRNITPLTTSNRSQQSRIQPSQKQRQLAYSVVVQTQKIKKLQYDNKQLSIVHNFYKQENSKLIQQIKTLQKAVNRYLYPDKQYSSPRKHKQSFEGDSEFQVMQSTLKKISQKLEDIKSNKGQISMR